MKNLSRRAWLGAGGMAALTLPVGVWLARGDEPRVPAGPEGGLRRDPERLFDLIEGFTYRVVDRAGRPMSDGFRVPPRPDGMACFPIDDATYSLVRNHELPAGLRGRAIGQAWPSVAYDAEAAGAVTRLVIDAESLEVRSKNLVLAGTALNCSGGPSPWGWLSAEEDASDRRHGFVFLCDPMASTAQRPVRIDGYGRFEHEAAAIDPDTHACYLTEDRNDSCLYRFVPHDPARPFEGRLQAMRIHGRRTEDTSPLRTGEHREIEWVDLRDPTPEQDDLRMTAQRQGAAIIKRGEGICYGAGAVHVVSTTGGPIGAGQIFRLEDGPDGGTLEVLAASTDRGVMDMPDNIVASPSGMLFFVEDGEGHDLLRCVRPDGSVLSIGRNAASEGEIAGVCFSPSGDTLFLNLQEEGLTLAIRGPFPQLPG